MAQKPLHREKFLECLHDSGWKIVFRFLPQQFMPSAFDFHEHLPCWDQGKGRLHLIVRAEGIAGAMDEQRGRCESRKMSGAQFGRFARRMERVGKQEKSRHKFGLFGNEHAALASAIRMAAEKDASRRFRPQYFHGTAQTFAVARG
jgi:hypothetical protein